MFFLSFFACFSKVSRTANLSLYLTLIFPLSLSVTPEASRRDLTYVAIFPSSSFKNVSKHCPKKSKPICHEDPNFQNGRVHFQDKIQKISPNWKTKSSQKFAKIFKYSEHKMANLEVFTHDTTKINILVTFGYISLRFRWFLSDEICQGNVFMGVFLSFFK